MATYSAAAAAAADDRVAVGPPDATEDATERPAANSLELPEDATPLMRAAFDGNTHEVRRFLTDGTDAAALDEASGLSPLMLAADRGDAGSCKALLEAGAPWNAIDRRGRCAGDFAAARDHYDAASELLEAGVRAELVLGAAQRGASATAGPSNNAFLQQRLSYDGDRLLDEDALGVMMAWEEPLMRAHAQAVAGARGDVLNVGFGMGLVDRAIQELQPRSHTIIEAHPDVHRRMLEEGWGEKPGVRIVFGRWQDVLSELGQFDGIFFDTFGEYYDDLRRVRRKPLAFHEQLPRLLTPEGLYSFFNGLAADNAFFHSVSCRVVAAELSRQGLDTTWIPLPINVSDDETWKGVALRYWQLDTYLLPVCEWASSAEDEAGDTAAAAVEGQQTADTQHQVPAADGHASSVAQGTAADTKTAADVQPPR